MQEPEDRGVGKVEWIAPADEPAVGERLEPTTDGKGRVDVGRARDVGRGELRTDRCGNFEHGTIFRAKLLEAPEDDIEEPLRQRLLDHAWRVAQAPGVIGKR